MKWSNDYWTSKCLEYDKWVHFAGSCALTLMVYWPLNILAPFIWVINALIAGAVVFVMGVLLEAWQESDGDGFSWRDLVANALGILLAVGVLVL